MKWAAYIAAAFALAAPVQAQAPVPVQVQTGPGTRFYSGIPPMRFQGEAVAVIVFLNREHLLEACNDGRPVPAGLQLMACARQMKKGPKVIFMPLPGPYAYMGEEYARLIVHEVGHSAFGWPGDHPL